MDNNDTAIDRCKRFEQAYSISLTDDERARIIHMLKATLAGIEAASTNVIRRPA